jgi:hypothetical protein
MKELIFSAGLRRTILVQQRINEAFLYKDVK